ncbi:MAG: hypothetical protein NC400_02260 [Clostridium sp.]|nr:hypothetical protein [Clostridium sp.]
MSLIETKIHSFAKKPSSIQHNKNIVRAISRIDIAKLNKTIAPKIRQNQRERAASMKAAAKCIVGGNLKLFEY